MYLEKPLGIEHKKLSLFQLSARCVIKCNCSRGILILAGIEKTSENGYFGSIKTGPIIQ